MYFVRPVWWTLPPSQVWLTTKGISLFWLSALPWKWISSQANCFILFNHIKPFCSLLLLCTLSPHLISTLTVSSEFSQSLTLVLHLYFLLHCFSALPYPFLSSHLPYFSPCLWRSSRILFFCLLLNWKILTSSCILCSSPITISFHIIITFSFTPPILPCMSCPALLLSPVSTTLGWNHKGVHCGNEFSQQTKSTLEQAFAGG